MTGAEDNIRAMQNMHAASMGGAEGLPPGGSIDKSYDLTQYDKLFAAGLSVAGSNYLNSPLKPYQQSLWVFKCVSVLHTIASGVPLRLMRQGPAARLAAKSFLPRITRSKKNTLRAYPGRCGVCVGKAVEGDVVEAGQAFDFLTGPNDYQDWPNFMRSTVGYYYLRGSVAWVMTDFTGRRPGQMHVVDGRHIKPVWGRDETSMPVLLGYEYTAPKSGRKVALSTDEVKYFYLWDDGEEPFNGMSPLRPGNLSVTTDYNASLYNASMLSNNAEPGMVIKFPGELTQEQKDAFRARLAERNQGAANAKKHLILEGGGDATPYLTTMADLQFDQGKKTTRLELCCLFGVPPAQAGWVESGSDASAYAVDQRKLFYESTIFPLLDGFIPAVNEIVSRFDAGLLAWFDVEDEPIVQEMRLSRLDSARKFFDMAYPPNAINDLLDLGMPQVPWGDVGFMPMGMSPVTDIVAGGNVPNYPEGTDTETDILGQEEARGQRPEARGQGLKSEIRNPKSEIEKTLADRLWADWAASWQPLAKRLRATLRQRYLAQQRKVTEAIQRLLQATEEAEEAEVKNCNHKLSAYSATSAATLKDSSLVSMIIFDVFEDTADNARFRLRVRAFLADANRLGVAQALKESGVTGDAAKKITDELLKNPAITQQIASDSLLISTRVDNKTRQILRGQLEAGIDAGEDARKLTDRVQSVMGNRRAAAMSVARNSIGQALSASRHQTHRAAGMSHKYWLHSRGPGKRRLAHIAAEARYRSAPIPLDEKFEINGVELLYPRDFSSGSAAETVGCQCLQIAFREAGKDGPQITRITQNNFQELATRMIAQRFVSYKDITTEATEAAEAKDGHNQN